MEDLEWMKRTKQTIGKLTSYLDQKSIERLLGLYAVEDDPNQKQEIKTDIETIIGSYAPQLLFTDKPSLQSPPLDECSGEIVLGTTMQGDKDLHSFAVSLPDLQKHAAIFGSTGFGKTTLIINILRQLLEHGIPFLYFDFKQDLRHIREWPLIVLRWNWMKINPLQPPKGVDAKQWMTVVADIAAHTFGWFWASENYLLQYMDKLYEEKEGKGYPTFREVYERIANTQETSRRCSEYRDVVLNRLNSALIVLNNVIDCEIGFPIEELLNYPVVIELDGLRRDEQNFVVELLLAYIFCYRMANGQRGKLRHVFVFDEATRVYFKKREYRETTVELGMPFIDSVPSIIRDYSEGLIFAAQEPSIISHSVLANTNLKIVGFLGEGEDIEAIAKSLDLEEDERSAIVGLKRGEWLVKKSGMKPFLMRSPDFPVEKHVSDAELVKRMQPILSRLEKTVKAPPDPKLKKAVQASKLPQLSEDAKTLLININSHPFMTNSSRCRALELSESRMESTKAELAQKDIANEVKIVLGNHGPAMFLVLTELGLSYLKDAGQDVRLWEKVGNVGFEHSLYQVLIAYSLKSMGWQAFIEREVGGGRRVDVLAIREDKKIGIEIELGKDDIGGELRCPKQLDELAILVANRGTGLRLSSETEVGKGKVWVCQASKFLSRLRGEIKVDKAE